MLPFYYLLYSLRTTYFKVPSITYYYYACNCIRSHNEMKWNDKTSTVFKALYTIFVNCESQVSSKKLNIISKQNSDFFFISLNPMAWAWIQIVYPLEKRRFYEILCNVTKSKIAPLFNAIASIGASALCNHRAVGRSENPGEGAVIC